MYTVEWPDERKSINISISLCRHNNCFGFLHLQQKSVNITIDDWSPNNKHSISAVSPSSYNYCSYQL